jgi:hypothetical protein
MNTRMSNRLECEPLPSSVRSARLFVVDKLQEWRCDDLVDRAALLTSELATNAVVHTKMPYSVRVERLGPMVRIEVADGVEALPSRHDTIDLDNPPEDTDEMSSRTSDLSDHCFSGLGIVEATATAWGSEARPGEGKVVWFELLGEHHDAAQGVRSEGVRDLRHSAPSHLAEDLDRPLDDWIIALDRPRLPRVAQVVLTVLLVTLVVVVALIVRG